MDGTKSTKTYSRPSTRNLRVILENGLNYKKYINAVLRACFFQLTMIAKVKQFLSFGNLEKVIHAFISSLLDYCSSLYVGDWSLTDWLSAVGSKCCSSTINWNTNTRPCYSRTGFFALAACAF